MPTNEPGLLRRSQRWAMARIAGRDVAVDVVHLAREVVPPDAAALLACAESPMTAAELIRRHGGDSGRARQLIELLVSVGLLVDHDEPEAVDQFNRLVEVADTSRPRGASAAYGELHHIEDGVAPAPWRGPLRVLLVGGCVVQFARSAVQNRFRRAGYDSTVRTCWPGASANDLVARTHQDQPDLLVLMPYVETLLRGLWDMGHAATPRVRANRTRALVRVLSNLVNTVATAAEGRLVLMHNLSGPGLSGFGRFEYLHEWHLRETVNVVNRELDSVAQQHENVVIVDEDRLVREWGARHLFDDHLFPFAHHGGTPAPDIDVPHQTPLLSSVLAEEYYACFAAHTGVDRVKCLAVDLDNTLWPGVLADRDDDWSSADTTSSWLHRGIHQALRIVKQRGVLLASVSKGDPESTLAAWRRHTNPDLLTPDDFVAHYIGWGPKSASLRQLCHELQVAPESVAVLDDFHVEREEIRKFGPPVRVIDEPVSEFRRWLLTEPGLQVRTVTSEASTRTETTRAALTVAKMADSSDGTYGSLIRDLHVRVRVRPPRATELERVVELVTRTTQFTLGGSVPSQETLSEAIRRDEIRVLSVADDLVDYGIVGACVVTGDTVRAVAVSCRVLALDVGPVFLTAALFGRDHASFVAHYTRSERNSPAGDLLRRSGFHLVTEHGARSEWRRSGPVVAAELAAWPHELTLGGDEGMT